MYSVYILIDVSMYLCTNIATYLHAVYVDWLQTVLDSNSRCTWRWRSRELRDAIWRLWWIKLGDEHAGHDHANLEAVIDRVWRYTCSLWFCKLGRRDWGWLEKHLGGDDRASLEASFKWLHWPKSTEVTDALRGWDRASLEMHYEAMIMQTWKPWLGEFWEALGRLYSNMFGCHVRVNWVMDYDAVSEQGWRYTWKPWSSEFWDTLGGRYQASLDIHLEAIIEHNLTSTCRWSIEGMLDADTLFIR